MRTARRPAVIEKALARMEAAGVPAGERGPPIHRLLWSLGIALPPPVLAGFWHNFVLMGSWFGALWGAMMWLLA